MAQKQTTSSYKSRKIYERPEDEWVVIENHHPAIIDKESYEIVRRLSDARTKPMKTGIVGALTGLVFCGSCGAVMRRQNPSGNRHRYGYYLCTKYTHEKARQLPLTCSRQSIRIPDLESLVLNSIKEAISDAVTDKVAFANQIRRNTNKESERTLKLKSAELVKSQRRVAELDSIIKRIYEDNISGRLSNERFDKMLADYETEQSTLALTVEMLTAEVEGIKAKQTNIETFIELAEQYVEVSELTSEVARRFIARVEVYEAVRCPDKPNTILSQRVDIWFNHIGAYAKE